MKLVNIQFRVFTTDSSIREDDGDSILNRDPNMLTSFDEPTGWKRQDSMASSYSEPTEVKLKKAISWNWNGKFEGLTLVLMLAVMSAVFVGSSTQFGFNTGVPRRLFRDRVFQ